MKKNLMLIMLMFLSATLFAQDKIDFNVVYEFSYVRDLDQADTPYETNMVLSLGEKSSRFSTEKLFTSTSRRLIEERKKELEKMRVMPSSGTKTAIGSPMLIVGKYGAIINEEIIKNFDANKLLLDSRIGIKTYHTETDLAAIDWKIQPDTKYISEYECQKAIGNYGGRTYEAWFTREIPYRDGPWKLHGLPGLIIEAKDIKNEVSFYFKEISQNEDSMETTESLLYDEEYSTKTNIKDLNNLKNAFEKDPIGVMTGQVPNAKVSVYNVDNPNDRTIGKIKKYNPIEL